MHFSIVGSEGRGVQNQKNKTKQNQNKNRDVLNFERRPCRVEKGPGGGVKKAKKSFICSATIKNKYAWKDSNSQPPNP